MQILLDFLPSHLHLALCSPISDCQQTDFQLPAGLVETSNNLAAVNPSADGAAYTIIMSSRSSIGSALEAQREIIAQAAQLCGASCCQDNAYPGLIFALKWMATFQKGLVRS